MYSVLPALSPPRASEFAPELQAGFLSMLYNKALHCCKVNTLSGAPRQLSQRESPWHIG